MATGLNQEDGEFKPVRGVRARSVGGENGNLKLTVPSVLVSQLEMDEGDPYCPVVQDNMIVFVPLGDLGVDDGRE